MSREAGLNKAPDAFRTISEVAEELDLPQHVLRFWESRFPHIKPLKRGGGRRYYRPEDIDLLRGIRRLLYSDGYTIKGVQRILREQGVRTVQSVGQGQDVTSLASPEPADGRDAAGESGRRPADVPPPGSRPLPDGADRSRTPLSPAQPVLPKNGPTAEAGIALVTQIARVGATKGPGATGAASSPVAPGSFLVKPGASTSPHAAAQGAAEAVAARAVAAPDLDRLKQALAELEACRRLLDKAMEGGR